MKAVFIYDPSDIEVQERLTVFPKYFIDGIEYTSLLAWESSLEVPKGKILSEHDRVVLIVENVEMNQDFISTETGILKGRITKK
jgi:hypothetical protein